MSATIIEKRRDDRERPRIHRTDPVEKARGETRDPQTDQHAHARASQREDGAVSQDHPENAAGRGADRQSYAQLSPTPRDRKADHAVHANGRNQQSDTAGYQRHDPHQPRQDQGVSNVTLHRPNVEDRKRLIGCVDRLPQPGDGSTSAVTSPRNQRHASQRVPGNVLIQDGQVDRGSGRLADRARLRGRDNSDDVERSCHRRERGVRSMTGPEMPHARTPR